MEDAKTVLKELRVDWETVLTEQFNPLHLCLKINKSSAMASDFRDMYHKLEFSMEKIIELNYKGFSDSILSYNQFYLNNKKLLESLNSSVDSIERTKAADFDIQNISNESANAQHNKAKYEICKNIREAKAVADEFEECEDLIKKSHLIMKCLEMIDKKSLIKIRGIEEFRKQIFKKYLDLCNLVNCKLFSYIFENEIENLYLYRCILILNGIKEFEYFCRKQFRRNIFNQIENISIKYSLVGQNGNLDGLEPLVKLICEKLESILVNGKAIIDKTRDYFEVNEKRLDFFGNEERSFTFLNNHTRIREFIENEISDIIQRYSVESQIANTTFDMDAIVDNIDYNKVYDPKYAIHSKLSRKPKFFSNMKDKYTIVAPSDSNVSLYFYKYLKDASLKQFAIEKIQDSSKEKIEESRVKIDAIFDGDWKRLDHSTGMLCFYRDLIKILSEVYEFAEYENADSNVRICAKSQLNGEYLNDESDNHKYIADTLYNCFINEHKAVFTSDLIKETVSLEYIGHKENCESSLGANQKDKSQNEKLRENGMKFCESLLKKYISKNTLFDKLQQYQFVIYSINTLECLSYKSKKIEFLHDLYLDSFQKQINVEFFYYFDLFYRQGNYHSYMKNIIKILKAIYDSSNMHDEQKDSRKNKSSIFFRGLYENIEYYCIRNSSCINCKSKKDLVGFVEHLKILDEILGEIEFANTLSELYKFYDEVLEGKSKNEFGMILQQKIGIENK
jgi:Sec8 exocyst complex component specific domain